MDPQSHETHLSPRIRTKPPKNAQPSQRRHSQLRLAIAWTDEELQQITPIVRPPNHAYLTFIRPRVDTDNGTFYTESLFNNLQYNVRQGPHTTTRRHRNRGASKNHGTETCLKSYQNGGNSNHTSNATHPCSPPTYCTTDQNIPVLGTQLLATLQYLHDVYKTESTEGRQLFALPLRNYDKNNIYQDFHAVCALRLLLRHWKMISDIMNDQTQPLFPPPFEPEPEPEPDSDSD